jgi:hypothetical protein
MSTRAVRSSAERATRGLPPSSTSVISTVKNPVGCSISKLRAP